MIARCLGVIVLLGPLMAMLAMVVYGVPQIAPSVVVPGWSDTADVDSSGKRKTVTAGAVEKIKMNVSGRPERLARPLPATSRRTRHQRLVEVPRSTWNDVRSALSAHGIRRFQIQPGSRSGEVHFSCVRPVSGLARVVRRYEAEAADPVGAARDVLQQIEQANSAMRRLAKAR